MIKKTPSMLHRRPTLEVLEARQLLTGRLDAANELGIPGDANLDRIVDFADFLSLQSNFGGTATWSQGDFNQDGRTSFSDFVLLARNYGSNTSASGMISGLKLRADDAPQPPKLHGPEPYRSTVDSPISFGADRVLEDFEGHDLTIQGVDIRGDRLTVTSAGFRSALFDSVDADDGEIDDACINCDSIWAWGDPGITVSFSQSELGGLPNKVGLVWTDGEGETSFEAFDSQGRSLGVVGPIKLDDGIVTSSSSDDHFFGVEYGGGISAVQIWNSAGGIEVDHIQFSDIARPFSAEGLQGWTIYIDENNNSALDTGELFDVTDPDGNYRFKELPPGLHIVREVQQAGWSQRLPDEVTDWAHFVTLSNGEHQQHIDFANAEIESPPFTCDLDEHGISTFSLSDRPAVGTSIELFDPLSPGFIGGLKPGRQGDLIVSNVLANGDLQSDLVTVVDGDVFLHLTSSDGLVGAAQPILSGDAITALAVADFSGSPHIDLILGDTTGNLRVLEGNGEGEFEENAQASTNLGSMIVDLTRGDFDGAGTLEIVAALENEAMLVAYHGSEPFVPPLVNGGFDDGLAGWEFSSIGHGDDEQPGSAIATSGVLELIENGSFLTTVQQTFTVPPSPETLSFNLLSAEFGSIGDRELPDAFEVSLLATDNDPLTATIGVDKTSLFNLSSNEVERTAAGVTWDGTEVVVDIRNLESGTKATLLFDLIGNGDDTATRIVLDDVQVTSSYMPVSENRINSIIQTSVPIDSIVACHANEDDLIDLAISQQPLRVTAFENIGGTFQQNATLPKAPSQARPPASDSHIIAAVSDTPIAEGELVETTLAAGVLQSFIFSAEAGDAYFFDALQQVSNMDWQLKSPSEVVLFDTRFSDLDAVSMPETGEYVLSISATGADSRELAFRVHRIPATAFSSIAIGDVVRGMTDAPGQVRNYTFEGSPDQRVFFDVLESTFLDFDWTVTTPSGSELFSQRRGDVDTLSLPEDGIYSITIDGRRDATGEYSFQIVNVPEASVRQIEIGEIVADELHTRGQSRTFTFEASVNQELFFDVLNNENSVLTWKVTSPDGTSLFSTRRRDVDTTEIPETGIYILTVDGLDDRIGQFSFRIVDVISPDVVSIELDQFVSGRISVPGQSATFTFEAEEGAQVFFDVIEGTINLGWALSSPSGDGIFNALFADEGPLEFPEGGTYSIVVTGRGDRIGPYGFRLWEISPAPVRPVVRDEVVSAAIEVPGGSLEYTFEANAGDVLEFDLLYNTATRSIDFDIRSPSNQRLKSGAFANDFPSTDYAFSVQETGLHSITFAGRSEGLLGFRLVQGELTPLDATPDLRARFVDVPKRVVGDPAEIEVEWEVTNIGSIPVKPDTIIADQFSFSADSNADGFGTDPPFARVETHLDAGLAPGASYRRREKLMLPGGINGELHLLLLNDFSNTVFEGGLEGDWTNNRVVSNRFAVFPEDRSVKDRRPSIQIDTADHSTFPAGTQLTLAGIADPAPSSVNLVFVIDTSGSTALVTGLDANQDGKVDERDNLNGDERVGDVLDTGIAAMMRFAEWFDSRVDDLLVSVIAFGSIDGFGRYADGSMPLDLGAEPWNQSFQTIGSDADGNSLSDFEESVRSLYMRQLPFNHHGGATKFREFDLAAGNDFGRAIEVLTEQLSRAPEANETFVYFITDGEPTTGGDVSNQQLDDLAAQAIRFNGVQITLDEISEPLSRAAQRLDRSGVSMGETFLATDPTLLSNALIGSIEVAGVTINSQPVDSFDAANRFSTVVEVQEGENNLEFVAIDGLGRSFGRTLTIFGSADTGPEQRQDLTSFVDAKFSYTTFNRQTNTLHALLAVDSESVSAPLEASFSNFSSPAVTLNNADLVGLDGEPVRLINELESPTEVQFSNPLRDRFDFDLTMTGKLNSPPSFETVPDVRVTSGTNYNYQPIASDPDRDQLTFSLLTSPEGMSIDADTGFLAWQTSADDIGAHKIELSASDGRGGTAFQSYQLDVTDAAINNAPLFASTPSTELDAGATYRYKAIANDVDGDPLTFALSTHPDGMEIDSVSGNVVWPNASAGEFSVSLTVDDGRGGIATQEFLLTVGDLSSITGLPQILSSAPTVATVEVEYVYPVIAADSDNDPLRYALPLAPDGMTIDASSGRIAWTPTTEQLGTQTVLVRVEDGQAGAVTQLFAIEVQATPQNRPPVFLTSPRRIATVGEPFSDTLVASDPDGDSFEFGVRTASLGLQLDSATGELQFTPTIDQLGPHRVVLTATDANDAQGELSYVLQVRPANTDPVFTSTPVTSVTANTPYRYRAEAEDTDDQVTYRVAEGPTGFAIDAFTGEVAFRPDDTLLGEHPVVLQAVDERGATAQQSYRLTVASDQIAPEVSVLLSSNLLEPGETATIRVVAMDDVGVANLSLAIDGQSVQLNDSSEAQFVATDPGILNIIGSATDSAGNTGQAAVTLRVIDPEDTTPPDIEITTPVPGSTLEFLTNVTGSVLADDLEFYRVQIAPLALVDLNNPTIDNPTWTTIAEDTNQVSSGTLATIDPTLLRNDSYAVRVVAQDFSGNIWVEALPFEIDGQAKIGEFAFEVTDLSVPLAGIPVEITRRYSSLDADISGDFGFGWSMDVATADIRETVPVGNEAIVGSFGAKAFQFGTRVYMTNPEGRRVGFTFEPTVTPGLIGAIWHPKFTPDPGVYDRLEVEDVALEQNSDGTFGLYLFGFNYNPSSYTLITPDQTRYTYDQFADTELTHITNRNGVTLSVDENGIHSNTGEEITWQRDTLGRVEVITDPNGNEIHYNYTTAGDLWTVTNQVDDVTTMGYLSNPPHLLDSIMDARGIEVLSLEYDSSGRLEAQIDAFGSDSRLVHDVENKRETIFDLAGNPTTLLYDERGNVLEESDVLGYTIVREYEDPLNPDLETRIIDKRDFVTDQEFDERGNLLFIYDRGLLDDPFDEPIQTSFTYNDNNDVTSVTDARGNTTEFRYEGPLLDEIENARGDIASFTYYDNGDVETFTDFRGNTTEFRDYKSGQPGRIIFADDTEQHLDYNQFGQTTYEAFFEADGTLVQERRSEFDAAGRLTREIAGSDADGSKTERRLFYEGDLLDWEIIVHPNSLNADGNLIESPATPVANRHSSITDYDYDPASRLIRQTDAEGGIIDFRYDAQGNRVALRDPVGNITTWLYDSLNRPTEERDPLYWDTVRTSSPEFEALSRDAFFELVAPVSPNGDQDPLYNDPSGASCESMTGAEHVILTCYDAEGNQAMTIDRNGRRREFEYEFDGELAEERWYDLEGELIRTMNFGYDAARNLDFASDPDSTYVFTYDSLNQLDTVDNAGTPRVPNIVLDYQFDAQGNPESISDNLGVTVASRYNERNLLEYRQWFDASGSDGISPLRIDFRYNAAGRISDMFRYVDLDATQLVGQVHRGYDLAGRSDTISLNDAVDNVLAAYDFGYDQLGHMDEDSRAGISSSYGYDLTGQLTSATRSNGNNESFSYDANGNRTLPGYITGAGNRLETDDTFTYGYDGEGNRISRTEIESGKVTRYEYDHRNRLTRITEQEVGGEEIEIAAYTYDALNRRIIIETAEGVTITVYDREQAWADFDQAGNVGTRYLYDDQIDFLLAIEEVNQDPTFVNTDHLGSVVGYVDIGGALIGTVAYQAFGELSEGVLAGRFGFTGREHEAVTNLYFYRARFYEPSVGRFISEDPIRYAADDPSLYRYVGNAPGIHVDPDGQLALLEQAILNAAVAGVLQAASGLAAGNVPCAALAPGVAFINGALTLVPALPRALLTVAVGLTSIGFCTVTSN